MKVYLLLTEDGKRVFYAQAPRSDGDPPVHGGLRGWAERKAHRLKTAWDHADHGVAGAVRHAWDWLNRRMPTDEAMLVRMRLAPTIEIHHPASLSSDEVRASWSEFLADRRRRHLPWLGVNTLVSPLTVLLAPLPGPNVVGYWFAYRAVRDLLALLGVRHARDERVETTFHPTPALDHPLAIGPGGRPGIESFLERSGAASPDGPVLEAAGRP